VPDCFSRSDLRNLLPKLSTKRQQAHGWSPDLDQAHKFSFVKISFLGAPSSSRLKILRSRKRSGLDYGVANGPPGTKSRIENPPCQAHVSVLL